MLFPHEHTATIQRHLSLFAQHPTILTSRSSSPQVFAKKPHKLTLNALSMHRSLLERSSIADVMQ